MLGVLKPLSVFGLLFAVLCQSSIGRAGGYGFDVGVPPAVHAIALAEADITGRQGGWMRVRGVTDPSNEKPGDARTVAGDRAGLAALRARGIKTAVFLRWESTSWAAGVRGGGGHRMPLDLREAYERGRRLGAAYGDSVDAWEIDNEPDIGFCADNPETFTAFLKAVYLGLKAGVESCELRAESAAPGAKSGGLGAGLGTWLDRKRGWVGLNLKLSSSTRGGAAASPRVIMAPLALPPGPYLERLWSNGIASYTDGFNFHYYGYAEDFSGVYGQFREAVAELGERQEVWGERVGMTEGANAGGKPEARGEGVDVRGRPADRSGYRGTATRHSPLTSRLGQRKSLPVFITEYGYGLMDAEARNTVEGRVRQWRWFADVAKQVRDLRIAAPMAFYWNPYYEANLNEFGLTADKPMRFAEGERPEARGERPKAGRPENRKSEGTTDTVVATRVGGDRDGKPLLFGPKDFGAKQAQPWMERIGKRVGNAYASPALAYLWDYAERNPYEPRDWSVRAGPASPVVIDFIAGQGLEQAKVSGGYVVTGHDDVGNYVLAGRGVWVVYNFSAETIRGRFEIQGDGAASSVESQWLTLAPGERREIAGLAGVQAQSYRGSRLKAVFVADGRTEGGGSDASSRKTALRKTEPECGSVAVWSTRLLPTDEWMGERRVAGFEFGVDEARDRRAALGARRLAEGEPPMRTRGRWLATDGVRVEEADGVWRFHVDMLPAEPLTPAMVELALPEGFTFGPGEIVMLEQRLGAAEGAVERQMKAEAGGPEARGERDGGAVGDARMRSRAGMAGDRIDVCFRTENGNLYQTWPRLRAVHEWSAYRGMADDFTMAFFGRAQLPWRLAENRPASLVFRLRPAQVPAVFEVRDARVARVERLD